MKIQENNVIVYTILVVKAFISAEALPETFADAGDAATLWFVPMKKAWFKGNKNNFLEPSKLYIPQISFLMPEGLATARSICLICCEMKITRVFEALIATFQAKP